MNNSLKNCLIIGLLMSNTFIIQAQDEKYIILDKKAVKEMTKKEVKKEIIVDNNVVYKFDPTRMVVGEINFGYERKIGANSTVEIELGPTISKLNNFSGGHYFPYDMSNSYYDERSSIGVFGSIGCRFYPKNGAFNGIYVSPKLKYKAKNTQFIDPSGIMSNEMGAKNQFSFVFNLGRQVWVTEKFSLDYYVGFGMGYDYVRTYSNKYVYDNNTGISSSSWSKDKYQNAKLIFNLGVKVGIGK